MSYEEKYLKYKNKYIELKNMFGGGGCTICGKKDHTNAECSLKDYFWNHVEALKEEQQHKEKLKTLEEQLEDLKKKGDRALVEAVDKLIKEENKSYERAKTLRTGWKKATKFMELMENPERTPYPAASVSSSLSASPAASVSSSLSASPAASAAAGGSHGKEVSVAAAPVKQSLQPSGASSWFTGAAIPLTSSEKATVLPASVSSSLSASSAQDLEKLKQRIISQENPPAKDLIEFIELKHRIDSQKNPSASASPAASAAAGGSRGKVVSGAAAGSSQSAASAAVGGMSIQAAMDNLGESLIRIKKKISVVNQDKSQVLMDAMFNLLLTETTKEEILDLEPKEYLIYTIGNVMYIIFKDKQIIKLLDLKMENSMLKLSLVDFPGQKFTRTQGESSIVVVTEIIEFLKDKTKPYDYNKYLKGIELTTPKNFI